MPTDHPDGTLPIAFIMADIKMPVDIQAQYVTLDVDITAQTIGNIVIDIAAQSVGNLDINVAASAVTLTVTVSGTADIDISAQSVGIYLMPDWASKEGNAKFISAEDLDLGWRETVNCNYTVPTGKILYITSLNGASIARNAADGDKNQQCFGWMNIAGTAVGQNGGNGGFVTPFTTPIKATAGQAVQGWICNAANHNVDMYINFVAYEVSA